LLGAEGFVGLFTMLLSATIIPSPDKNKRINSRERSSELAGKLTGIVDGAKMLGIGGSLMGTGVEEEAAVCEFGVKACYNRLGMVSRLSERANHMAAGPRGKGLSKSEDH